MAKCETDAIKIIKRARISIFRVFSGEAYEKVLPQALVFQSPHSKKLYTVDYLRYGNGFIELCGPGGYVEFTSIGSSLDQGVVYETEVDGLDEFASEVTKLIGNGASGTKLGNYAYEVALTDPIKFETLVARVKKVYNGAVVSMQDVLDYENYSVALQNKTLVSISERVPENECTTSKCSAAKDAACDESYDDVDSCGEDNEDTAQEEAGSQDSQKEQSVETCRGVRGQCDTLRDCLTTWDSNVGYFDCDDTGVLIPTIDRNGSPVYMQYCPFCGFDFESRINLVQGE